MIGLSSLPQLSLYIHIPWCIKKCPYCDFNSHMCNGNNIPEDRYIMAIAEDIARSAPLVWNRTIESIFIGGGTPSLFSGDAIDAILLQCRSMLRISPFAEITLEANPGAIDTKHFAQYKASGVNRLSIGVQSFNSLHLKALGRIHNEHDAVNAIEIAMKYFDNVNVDMMYALPAQSLNEVLDDIQDVLQFAIQHISCYNLTIEPNTLFAKYTPNLPSNDECYSMQEAIISLLAAAGFARYEISAYAKNNYQCKHNLNYWNFGDYLGVGAGAHSKISLSDRIIRRVVEKQPMAYMSKIESNKDYFKEHDISTHELPFEFLLNTLRLIDGFPVELFTRCTGLALNTILDKLLDASNKGLLLLKNGRIIPTKLGSDFLNDLLLIFLENKDA